MQLDFHTSDIYKMKDIIGWLELNKDQYYNEINASDCGKWLRWIELKEKPLPCCCEKRTENCVFIELYYELQKLVQLHQRGSLYKEALKHYINCSHDKVEELRWLQKNFGLGTSLFLNTSSTGDIRVKIYNSNPLIDFQIAKEDFKDAIKFNHVFDELYYEIERVMLESKEDRDGNFQKTFKEMEESNYNRIRNSPKLSEEQMVLQMIRFRIRSFKRENN